MKLPGRIKIRRRFQLLIAGLLGLALAVVLYAGTTSRIDSYTACKDAGFPILDTEPPICRDGLNNFTGTPAASPKSSQAVTSVPFDILVDGDTHGAAPAHSQVLINDQGHWQSYWRAAHANLATLPPLIPVDFANSSVVAVSLGSRPTGGYGLKITSVVTGAKGSTVSVTETSPGPGCITTQAITNRYVIVETSKLTEPASFRINTDQRNCR
jgi:hypothetical protein